MSVHGIVKISFDNHESNFASLTFNKFKVNFQIALNEVDVDVSHIVSFFVTIAATLFSF